MQMFLPPIYHTSYSYTIFFTLKQYLNYTNCNIEKLKLVNERLIPSYHHHPQKSEASKSVCSQTNFSLFLFFFVWELMFHLLLHKSLSIISLIICIGISPSVRIASLFGSGLIKNSVGKPRT